MAIRRISVGMLKEIKKDHLGRRVEFRALFTPKHVRQIIKATKAPFFVETGAGESIGASDAAYKAAGAKIAQRPIVLQQPYVVSVKETQPGDNKFFGSKGPALYDSYKHYAEDEERMEADRKRSEETDSIYGAFETMQKGKGMFPMLYPMSVIAGLNTAHFAPQLLMRPYGPGRLITKRHDLGVPGINALVIGGGTVGMNAAIELARQGINVTVLESNAKKIMLLKLTFIKMGLNIKVKRSTQKNLEKELPRSHICISAVYVSGKNPPKIIKHKHIKSMPKGSVLVDVAIDQGGILDFKAHECSLYDLLEPAKIKVLKGTDTRYFSLPNIPSMTADDSSAAIANAYMSYCIENIRYGMPLSALRNPIIASGINIAKGKICHPGLAEAVNRPFTPFTSLIFD